MDSAEKPRELVIHQSANRPNMLLGGDRELVLVTIMVTGGLAFSLACWWGFAVAIVLWLVAVGALQLLRHVRYSGFYPAKSGLHAQPMETPRGWR